MENEPRLQRDRLAWAILAGGMLFYALLGMVLMIFAMRSR